MICDERENPTRVCFDCVLCVSDGLCVCSLVILVVLCVCVPLSKICVWRDSLVAPTTTPRTGRRDGSLSRLANAASAGGVARGREVLENIPSLVALIQVVDFIRVQRSGVREVGKSRVRGGAATWPSLAAVAVRQRAKTQSRETRVGGARPGPRGRGIYRCSEDIRYSQSFSYTTSVQLNIRNPPGGVRTITKTSN